MKRAILMAVLLAAAAIPCAAAKITTDPNASAKPPVKSSEKPDPRLSQKVTYQGGYKRLHAVAEELTRQTGVTIRCGSSAEDWRVRDVPLVVCVRDMPLGELLKSIAACAHASLTTDQIANSRPEKPTYRLCRTREQEHDISSAVSARAEASRKLADWTWDTLAAYADMPDASDQIKPTPELDAAQVRAVAQALKALGGQAEKRMLSGGDGRGRDRRKCQARGTQGHLRLRRHPSVAFRCPHLGLA